MSDNGEPQQGPVERTTMDNGLLQPVQTSDIDTDLTHLISTYHRLRWIALGVLGILVLLIIAAIIAYVLHLRGQVATECSFFRDLGRLPLTPVPPTDRPSALGVTIVADSHIAAVGLGCSQVPALSPSEIHWAAYYHIPLR